jgi:ubiquinone/menaquinone biosynthesis C-methylase UbiE
LNHLESYLQAAPISLALERAIEARWLASVPLADPLLDLGCGDGLFAERTFERALRVGLDRDPSELAIARSRRSYRSLTAADASRLPFRAGAFATVISNSVLEHLTDLPGTLAEVRRVLRRDGRFWFSVPSPLYGKLLFNTVFFARLGLAGLSRWYENLVNVRLQKNFHCLAMEEWTTLLADAGLRIVKHERYLPRAVMFVADLGYPLATPAMLWKRWLGRWTLSPRLRKPVAAVLARLLNPVYVQPCPEAEGGGWLIEATPAA